MNNENFLWYEMCDTINEKISYIRNELEHYQVVFKKNNMVVLTSIIDELFRELNKLIEYKDYVLSQVENYLIDYNSSHELYSQFNWVNAFTIELLERIKFIIYCVFNRDVRRRMNIFETTKIHELSRDLCNFYSSNIHGKEKPLIEAHFGYDAGYYWKKLTSSLKGLINAPRINSYCTRFLPIYAHEVSHPIIELNSNEILNDPIFREGFIVSYDFIGKQYLEIFNHYSRENIKNITTNIYSEILCDIFSTVLCRTSYLMAFSCIGLRPDEKLQAINWYMHEYWQSHPPNNLRFSTCKEALRVLGHHDDVNLLEQDWNQIKTLQRDFNENRYTNLLDDSTTSFLEEFPIDAIVNRLKDIQSPITISDIQLLNKDISQISEEDYPIEIINSIWETRYNRWEKGTNLSERETSKILKILYYSLKNW